MLRKRATVPATPGPVSPLVMTSLAPALSSIGAGAGAGHAAFCCRSRTLRRAHVMLHDTGAQQIVTDNVIVQLGAKPVAIALALRGGKLDGALSERVAATANGNRAR